MHLDYLLFDFSDDDAGACSFDAMACVRVARLPALVREVEAVLAWAHRAFGAPSGAGDEGGWDFELQATLEPDTPLPIAYDAQGARLSLAPPAEGRVTLALTLTGPGAFGAALRDTFPEPD